MNITRTIKTKTVEDFIAHHTFTKPVKEKENE